MARPYRVTINVEIRYGEWLKTQPPGTGADLLEEAIERRLNRSERPALPVAIKSDREPDSDESLAAQRALRERIEAKKSQNLNKT